MKKKVTITAFFACSLITISLFFYLYHLFKPGYIYENATWNYVSYDTGAGRRVDPIDVSRDEFKVLKHNDFARDIKSVYFKSTKVEGSDPDTFQIISDKGRYRYAKDKKNVYIYTIDGWLLHKVINADPNSFEVLEFPYSKDKNDAYCGNLPLYVEEVSKFKVIEGTDSAIMSTVYSFLGTENDPSDKSSEYERKKHEYNLKKYGFITEWVFYSEDGKAKTDKYTYKGYKLVEGQR
jgi:hypothetical protein